MAELVVVSALEGAGGSLPTAAALGVALAGMGREAGAVVLGEVGGRPARGPTMLASAPARDLEAALGAAGYAAAARGRLGWVCLERQESVAEEIAGLVDAAGQARFVVAHVAGAALRDATLAGRGRATVVLRADLPSQRSLTALAARELRDEGVAVRFATRAPGRVASRRALAGIDPGGEAGRRARRLARGICPARPRSDGPSRLLASETGQALPLVLGSLVALIACALVLAAFGGAITGASRVQRTADLAALSAARSMRDDFDRLFVPARLADGEPNPAHLSKGEYLARAQSAAAEAGSRNGVAPQRLDVAFPDAESMSPLQVRVTIAAELREGDEAAEVEAYAEAEAVPGAAAASADAGPAYASGGGYSGPLVYRQGEGMRPDVAEAFDRMAAAAARDGIALTINSAFRSDAEQAILFAEHPDPTWVAPPGQSLHRCATELDLGPPAAEAWLPANAGRFGFLLRYSWEPWHVGFVDGPAPCSAEADAVEAGGGSAAPRGDGAGAAVALPDFVPARFRPMIAAAAGRWNVSASLLAAQLMAESNFNPFAVSPAGAAGIAQFMPGTAAMYGLANPFDPEASINAQAHLMSDLLEQFGSPELALAAYNAGPGAVAPCGCVPAIPETQAYVARILGLMDGAGVVATAAPLLEVRLVD